MRRRRPPATSDKKPQRPLSWWWIPLAAAAVAATAWATTTWLLGEASQIESAAEGATVRIEAVRTGLTAGAGLGAAVALLLSFRRQRHQEVVAAATEHDASERRITELYTKAVEQLGSDKAAVRLGGLYALERLGEDTPRLRQTIVDVLCAYLRMPYSPPEEAPAGEAEPATASEVESSDEPPAGTSVSAGLPAPTSAARPDPREERQVRLTAQRILGEHLRDDRSAEEQETQPPDARFWPGMRLDLTGAVLLDLDFTRCRLDRGVFSNATFFGNAGFGGARFSGDALFGRAKFFGGVEFGRARFSGDARFLGTSFSGWATFLGASFAGDAVFDGAFFGDAAFGAVMFSGVASFSDALVLHPSAQHHWPPGWRFRDNESGQWFLVPDDEEQPSALER